MAKPDSHEFLVKTNKEVDEWMDSFYVEGRKADHRLHCQWAWQEQERRKEKLIDALSRLLKNDCPLTGNPSYEQLVEHWEYEKSQGRGEADDQLFALRTLHREQAK
ncbi:hypothetical protein D3C85_622280 [compost metagenome]